MAPHQLIHESTLDITPWRATGEGAGRIVVIFDFNVYFLNLWETDVSRGRGSNCHPDTNA